MKKLKLFQKTYLFTMALMGVMIIISHTLLYMLLPTFYINKKQQDLSDISTQLIQQLESNNKDMSSKIAKDFSNKYGINIALNIRNLAGKEITLIAFPFIVIVRLKSRPQRTLALIRRKRRRQPERT